MDLLEVMKQRHSVRQYTTDTIEQAKREKLDQMIKEINEESGLSMQIFYDEVNCFKSFLSKYGFFTNANNYIAIVGQKNDEELAGYYGEKLVLFAQSIGLNTCWVGLTHGKTKAVIKGKEKLIIIITIGYGQNQGAVHKNKDLSKLIQIEGEVPEWFYSGMEAVLLAPTAINQQKFLFTYKDGKVSAKAKRGPYAKVDLGIVKYHFEAVSLHKVD